MPNPGLPADKKAIIRSNLEVGLSPAKIAHLMNIPYTVYTYYINLQDYGEMISPMQGKLGGPKAMIIYIEDVFITYNIIYYSN